MISCGLLTIIAPTSDIPNRLIENGADIKAVSKLMGHASIRMTAEYVQSNPERLKRLALAAS